MVSYRVFLSSTYRDLFDIRREIAEWLSGVFGVELIVMETFGSDADPPDVLSVHKVRDCELFVGIYAHRYGTVDKATGKSITELEFDEAEFAFSAGVLDDVLLYVISPSAPWPNAYREADPVAQQALSRFKERVAKHTYTPFVDRRELLFTIVRDVYRRIAARLKEVPRRVRVPAPMKKRAPLQPFGMQFLTSGDSDYLFGRETEVDKLFRLLRENPIVLFLGDSGVGKTSLIHAGLVPRVQNENYWPIYTRSFGFPQRDVARQIESTVFEGSTSRRPSPLPLLAEIQAAISPKIPLLIIDQFEDILTANDPSEVEALVADIQGLRTLHDESVRTLISYRADQEGRLGHYWQQISGSPSGLPRVYISGLHNEDAWHAITKTLSDLHVTCAMSDEESRGICSDLAKMSRDIALDSVYPPYLQILIEHAWSESPKHAGTYSLAEYTAAGGIQRIVASYLARQLQYARDTQGYIQSVLTALVRGQGSKRQVTVSEITTELGIDQDKVESALERLIDLRLVRHIDEIYELAHDFLAHKIFDELIDPAEMEFRRFRELLESKAAAYNTTHSLLTAVEMLMLFKHRSRVKPKPDEADLLLRSWLQRKGPALMWLLSCERERLVRVLRGERESEKLDDDAIALAALMKRALTGEPFQTSDYRAFDGYKLATELSFLIRQDASSVPKPVLLYGTLHLREEVCDASFEAIKTQISKGDWSWIKLLSKSASRSRRRLYERLVVDADIALPPATGDRALRQFAWLKALVKATPKDAKELFATLRRSRMSKRDAALAQALVLTAQGRDAMVVRKAAHGPIRLMESVLRVLSPNIDDSGFDFLVNEYEAWNQKEFATHSEDYKTKEWEQRHNVIFTRAVALSDAVLRCSSGQNVERIRSAFERIQLTESSRLVAVALLRAGNLEDLFFLLHRIADCQHRILYWNHTAIGLMVAQRTATQPEVPKELREILRREEFWDSISPERRRKLAPDSLLLLGNNINRPLYVRLAGYAAIGAAQTGDSEVLLSLSLHPYGLVAQAAVRKYVQLLGGEAIQNLSNVIDQEISKGKSEVLANALMFAEMQFYKVAEFSVIPQAGSGAGAS